jgi:hypothetical protein
MPPRTRRGDPMYVIVDEDKIDLLVSKHLASRLFDAEREVTSDKVCPICLDACCCRHCASYTKCVHGPFHFAVYPNPQIVSYLSRSLGLLRIC